MDLVNQINAASDGPQQQQDSSSITFEEAIKFIAGMMEKGETAADGIRFLRNGKFTILNKKNKAMSNSAICSKVYNTLKMWDGPKATRYRPHRKERGGSMRENQTENHNPLTHKPLAGMKVRPPMYWKEVLTNMNELTNRGMTDLHAAQRLIESNTVFSERGREVTNANSLASYIGVERRKKLGIKGYKRIPKKFQPGHVAAVSDQALRTQIRSVMELPVVTNEQKLAIIKALVAKE